MRCHGYLRLAATILTLFVFLSLSPLALGATQELQVKPNLVEIGAWFRGQTVTATAMLPKGAEIVIEVMGQAADEHLMRKGRRGALWMNVGEIDFQHAPSLYMVMSTNPKLLSAAPPEAPWGFAALKRRATMSGMVTDQEKDEFFEQFIKLKESEDLYASSKEPIKKSRAVGDLTPIEAKFRLPTNVKPGAYEVCLSVVQDGQVIAKNCQEIQVKMVGFPAMLSSLAYEHGATYGILAVIIAIITGFAMGFLFKGGGGH
ncbi:MAG: TIGR02186 family protein [Deltaproteobacteria bacterium]|nr:TIGR02186 family protein [Deltaproteobacteria bacterium]